jgi:hypothetical protein
MNKKVFLVILAGIAGQGVMTFADNSMANQIGVGARAFSFANNYVAASNDMSSVYWNPAALSFLPVREAQAAFDVLGNTSATDYFQSTESSSIRRIRLASAGFMSAVPTARGGLTFAAALQSPVVFERNPSFHGMIPNTAVLWKDVYRGFGDLRYWSGAFGIQVAPGLGIGIAPSLVTGRETIRENLRETTSGVVTRNNSYNLDRTYFGYDLRAGILYSLVQDRLHIGGRLVFPQTIWFNEKWIDSGNSFPGVLASSFSGAMGAAVSLPFGMVSTEFRFRAPYDYLFPEDNIPENSPARHFKNGGGIGAEIPLLKTNVLLRGGYSLDEFDLYQYAMKYDNEPVGAEFTGDSITGSWGTNGIEVNNNRQELTFGLAYVTIGFSIEATYGYQFWKLTTNGNIGNLHENEHLQRIMISLSTRF